MLPVNHTRARSAVPLCLALTLVAGACGSKPIYEFEPTDPPLHYTLKSEGGNDIETPAGAQSASFSSEASLTVAFEKETEAGTPFTITIESIVLQKNPIIEGVLCFIDQGAILSIRVVQT